MGMGHLHLRKILKAETTYKDKSSKKHKCNFEKHCVLKVTDLDNVIEYFNVMKCSDCLSFKSISEPGNVRGCILQDLTEEQKNLPVITGTCKHNYRIAFADLENVSYDNNRWHL